MAHTELTETQRVKNKKQKQKTVSQATAWQLMLVPAKAGSSKLTGRKNKNNLTQRPQRRRGLKTKDENKNSQNQR